MSEVQIAIIDQENTQIALAVPGVQGPAGAISSGGSANQVFYKVSGTNYDAGWTFIGNANVDAAAAIAGTKISPNFGSQTVATTGVFSHALGSQGAPTITFTGDTNTGIYSPGADQVAISTNGSGRLFVDSSGRVGIGGSPSTALHLGGSSSQTIRINSNTSAGFVGTTGYITQIAANRNPIDGSIVNTGTATAFINLEADVSNGSIQFCTTGTNNAAALERMRITSAGLVGIGTSLPGTNLDIVVGSGTATQKLGSSSVSGGSYLNLHGASASKTWFIGANYNVSGALEFIQSTANGGTTPSSTPAMTLDSSGRLGIGTTSPGYLLDVASSVAQVGNSTDAFIQYKSTAGNWHVGANSSNAYVFYSGTYGSGTERARIDSSGRLLVGTSSESGTNLLQIQGSTAASSGIGGIALRRGVAPSGMGEGSIMGYLDFGPNDGGIGCQIVGVADGTQGTNDYPGRLVFSTTADGASSPTERMRIASNGEIQFGNTTNGAYTVTRNPGICAYFDRRTSDGVVISFERQGAGVGNISVTTTATAYNTSSDYRLKENVTPVTDGITRFQQLKPSRFNFIADPDKTVDGFLAHEVQAIVPEAITGEKDAVDEDGNPIYQGIDQSKLVPLLTAALQEAVARIEQLETAVATIQGQ